MADITIWDPFAEMASLRRGMEQFFEGTGPRRGFNGSGSEAYFPLDLYETRGEIVVKASLPGVSPENIDISVTGQLLTLKAESRNEDDVPENYYRRERKHGIFVRQLTLPAEVDSDKADATFEHGVLRLSLPKAESMKPRTIRVTSVPSADGTGEPT